VDFMADQIGRPHENKGTNYPFCSIQAHGISHCHNDSCRHEKRQHESFKEDGHSCVMSQVNR